MAHVVAGTADQLDRETELVLRAAGGEREAYDVPTGPRLGRLFRMARAIVRDETLARDVVQDTCVTAWR